MFAPLKASRNLLKHACLPGLWLRIAQQHTWLERAELIAPGFGGFGRL